MVEDKNESNDKIIVEPIENFLRRKYIMEEKLEENPSSKHLIPLPQLEEPLIDIFEDDNYVKVLMQCHCRNQKVTIQRGEGGLEICLEEGCRKLNLPVEQLQIENMSMKCNNNEAFEVDIPKLRTTINYDN
jgi:hypothetical protein